MFTAVTVNIISHEICLLSVTEKILKSVMGQYKGTKSLKVQCNL